MSTLKAGSVGVFKKEKPSSSWRDVPIGKVTTVYREQMRPLIVFPASRLQAYKKTRCLSESSSSRRRENCGRTISSTIKQRPLWRGQVYGGRHWGDDLSYPGRMEWTLQANWAMKTCLNPVWLPLRFSSAGKKNKTPERCSTWQLRRLMDGAWL